ncbi:hypothetical protein [Streptomyces alboflavus]|uniref:hypothetical protein n=1 Tax=Streptomyces alboflavus TaxID=67267 RepID=UPI00068E8214|nr:hypothetical protein [Streptomyces alboflavus]
MSNIFSGGGRDLDLSNGATAVFVDVLMLAVSDLASEGWDFRFAALLSLQDQDVMGRGAVGFDLAEFDWGATERERARAKDFVLRAAALAASGHRWSELGYHPPRVQDHLHRFAAMVESFTPPADSGAARGFPSPDEAATASCARHRVLSALPLWDGCFLCDRPHQGVSGGAMGVSRPR